MIGFRTAHTGFFLFCFLRHESSLVGCLAPSGSPTWIWRTFGICFRANINRSFICAQTIYWGAIRTRRNVFRAARHRRVGRRVHRRVHRRARGRVRRRVHGRV